MTVGTPELAAASDGAATLDAPAPDAARNAPAPGRFAGKTIVVTGAGSGIGHATTQKLCAEGAHVLALDICFANGMPPGAECLSVDVCSEDRLAEAARRVPEGIDGLATFAGIEMGGRIDTLNLVGWQRVLDVNVLGTVRSIAAFLPALRRRQGSILMCSSQLSLSGAEGCAAYAASKGAINSLCSSLALDHADEGIRVNAIAPGATETPMMTRAFRGKTRDAIEGARNRHALRRFGTPEESASAALFFLSDESGFVTGTVLPVDGGWTIK